MIAQQAAVAPAYTNSNETVRIKVTGTAKNALAAPDLTGKIAIVTDASSECKYVKLSIDTQLHCSDNCDCAEIISCAVMRQQYAALVATHTVSVTFYLVLQTL